MSVAIPIDGVLWLSDVALSRERIEVEISASTFEYGQQKSGSLRYAKYVFSNDVWQEIGAFFDRNGLVLRRLIASGAVGAATLDLAYLFADENVTRSAQIPARIAASAGQCGVDLVISTYPANPD